MIKSKPSKLHWNYFLAIETHSIELAHILLSASSEVDVLLREICNLKNIRAENMNDYRSNIQKYFPEFLNEPMYLSRYGLEFRPWENWNDDINPDWWLSHNKVKHERNQHFELANLQNALNAVGALLICVTYYYQIVLNDKFGEKKKLT